ncbi:MAG: type II toxin-antitoxin system Phd/YefM family antitoxin [Synechococcaceae cyanobacterium]|jgi:prevent-host-death family protein
MADPSLVPARHELVQAVPLAEAKNHLSALVARVEKGEEIAITRRGVPVVRLVPDPGEQNLRAGRREQVAAALERLHQLRANVVIEGDLRAIAREGLD